MSRLALIAGSGALPATLVQALDPAPLVCALDGFTPEGVPVDLVFRVERLAPFLRHLTDEAGVSRVVFAGAIHRPRLDPALFDPETAGLLPRLMALMQGGDDATLRAVIALFEDFGLEVQGFVDLVPELLAAEGEVSQRAPSEAEQSDASRAQAVLAALDPVDVGQGCVVAGGLCLAVETLFGTDLMLADLARNRPSREPRTGGVFVKRAKAGQDLRVDLPTIGPATIDAAVAAGLSGICLQAGHVLVLSPAEVRARADAAGLALWAVP